jgi:hypothetical protein
LALDMLAIAVFNPKAAMAETCYLAGTVLFP